MNVAVPEIRTLFEVGSLGGLSDGQLLDRFVCIGSAEMGQNGVAR
jgi:hypothetical protein